MENLSTLMGKYGEEGDKLLFKILNSGDFLRSASDEELDERNCPKLASKLCVPFGILGFCAISLSLFYDCEITKKSLFLKILFHNSSHICSFIP